MRGLGRIFLVGLFFCGLAAAEDFNGPATYLVVVNGYGASAEQLAGKQVYKVDYEKFRNFKVAAAIENHPRHRELRNLIEAENLSAKPFAVEFSTVAKNELGSVYLWVEKARQEIAPAAFPPPSPLPAPPVTVNRELATRALIEASLAAEGSCALQGQKLVFSNAILARAFAAAGVETSAALSQPQLLSALDDVAARATFDERSAIFRAGLQSTSCLAATYRTIWAKILESRRSELVRDFYDSLRAVASRPNSVRYVETEHAIVYSEAQLNQRMALVQELLLKLSPREFQLYLPRDARAWATQDNNSDRPESRTEPIDLLALYLGSNYYASLANSSDLGVVGRNDVVRRAIARVLSPETDPPFIAVSKSPTGRILFCGGESLTITRGKIPSPTPAPILTLAIIPESEIAEMQRQGGRLEFTCGTTAATLTAESVGISLRDPLSGDDRFTYGADQKIKAVASFPLVNQASAEFIARMKLGTLGYGFIPVGEEIPSTQLKQDFLTEMLDTDFYFAAHHKASVAQMPIGVEGSRILRLARRTEKGTIEFVLFLPPVTANGKPGVTITDFDIAELYRRRRQLPELRRLTVLNISCGSGYCVPGWTDTFRSSLVDNNRTFPNEANLLRETPAVIASAQSFKNERIDDLIAHSRFPFETLNIAAREGTLREMLQFLTENNFKPVSNLGTGATELLNGGLKIVITTAQGERLVF